MRKKSQMNSQILVYALIVIIAVMIFAFGAKMIAKFVFGKCETEFKTMKVDFSSSADSLANRPGDREEKAYQIGCNFDTMMMVDTQNVLPEEMVQFPEIANSIEEGKKENVFVYKDGKLYDLFYAKADISFPHFICMKPIDNAFRFSLVGKPKGVDIKETYPANATCNPTVAYQTPEMLEHELETISQYSNMKRTVVNSLYDASKSYLRNLACLPFIDTDGFGGLLIILDHERKLSNLHLYHFVTSDLSGTPTWEFLPLELEEHASMDPNVNIIQSTGAALPTAPYGYPMLTHFEFDESPDDKGTMIIKITDLDRNFEQDAIDYCNIVAIDQQQCNPANFNNDCIAPHVCTAEGRCV
jgi:hypothetical protein